MAPWLMRSAVAAAVGLAPCRRDVAPFAGRSFAVVAAAVLPEAPELPVAVSLVRAQRVARAERPVPLALPWQVLKLPRLVAQGWWPADAFQPAQPMVV